MKALITFADAQYLVDPDAAARVQQVAAGMDRFVTVAPIQEDPPSMRLEQQRQKESASVFDRYQHPLTDRQGGYAQRLAKHLAVKRPR